MEGGGKSAVALLPISLSLSLSLSVYARTDWIRASRSCARFGRGFERRGLKGTIRGQRSRGALD